MWMISRKVKKEQTNTVTIKLGGLFKTNRKEDFYNLIK